MSDPLRVLILEDNPADAELMADALAQAGLAADWERVETEAAFAARLTPELDLILSDYLLPQFSGMRALKIARGRGLDVPFILVSGSIGEEVAVEAMLAGADDYLFKDRIARLGQAARRAVEKRRLRIEKERAESALRASEARNAAVIGAALDCVVTIDHQGRILEFNPAAETAFRYRRAEVLGRPIVDCLVPPALREAHSRGFERYLLTGKSAILNRRVEVTAIRGDGIEFPVELAVVRVGIEGPPVFTAFIRDITRRRQQEQKIDNLSRVRAVSGAINSAIIRCRSRRELFDEACRIAVEHGNFGMAWVGTFDPVAMEVLPAAWAGFEAREFLEDVKIPVHEDPARRRGVVAEAVITRAPVFDNDITRNPHLGGARRQEAIRRGYRSNTVLPLTVEGAVAGTLALFVKEPDFFDDGEMKLLAELAGNISFALEHLASREKVDYLAYYDALTALPNRTLFIDRTGQQLRARGGEAPMVALILVNLERFRNINETLGRSGGDEVLELVARRLEQAFHGKDYLARTGADSFGVVLRGLENAAAVAQALESRLFACFHEPFTVGGRELRVAARAGVALYPADGGDADALFRNAEAALKKAKETGEPCLFYAAEMNARAAHALSLETRLRKAVEAQQFVLHYQPKIDLAGRTICGLEALIRWQEPGAGLVAPGAFIPVLEETGLILEAGKWALRRALADQRTWTARGCAVPRIAVIVSAIQLQRGDFADVVIDAVRQEGEVPAALELEVTESLLMKDIQASIRKLSILRERGIQLAMDDFGTGYSSLSYIARLPIDSVKIDRSFVGRMASGPHDMAIVTTIIALAHALNLKVVAEGVETAEQARTLAALGCDEAQGFFYCRPLPAAEIEPLLRAPDAALRGSTAARRTRRPAERPRRVHTR